MARIPKVNQETCIGCGTCAVIAEKTFKLGSNGKAQAILPPGDEEKTIQEAIDACAVGAITWSEDDK